jgi:hypothetical protein
MARVKMIPPETTDAETRDVYDGVLKQWGRISNFSQVLAHQPAALAGWMLPNDAIRLVNVKADPDYVKIQQLVIIKTSALNRSACAPVAQRPARQEDRVDGAQIAAAQGDGYGFARSRRTAEGAVLGRGRHQDDGARDDGPSPR